MDNQDVLDFIRRLKDLVEELKENNKKIHELGKNLTYRDMPNEEYQNAVRYSSEIRVRIFKAIDTFEID